MELYYLCRNPSGDFYVTKDDEELTMEKVVTELQDKTQRIEALRAALKEHKEINDYHQQYTVQLETAIKDALLCDNYVQITEVLQQALLPGRGE